MSGPVERAPAAVAPALEALAVLARAASTGPEAATALVAAVDAVRDAARAAPVVEAQRDAARAAPVVDAGDDAGVSSPWSVVASDDVMIAVGNGVVVQTVDTGTGRSTTVIVDDLLCTVDQGPGVGRSVVEPWPASSPGGGAAGAAVRVVRAGETVVDFGIDPVHGVEDRRDLDGHLARWAAVGFAEAGAGAAGSVPADGAAGDAVWAAAAAGATRLASAAVAAARRPPPSDAVPGDGTGAPAPAWVATHRVPDGGMTSWPVPDPRRPPTRLAGGVELRILDRRGAWAQVEAANLWRGWVDARLVDRAR